MQGHNIDPGSNDFNNFNCPNPFSKLLTEQPIWAIVHHMGVHTPSQKIQKVIVWYNMSKLWVDQEVATIVDHAIYTNFPPGIPYNRRTNARYLEIQSNGRTWTQQRVAALEHGKKVMIDNVLLSETWVSLMPTTPYNWAYMDWVKNYGANPNEMDSLQNQVALMSVNGKPKK